MNVCLHSHIIIINLRNNFIYIFVTDGPLWSISEIPMTGSSFGRFLGVINNVS